MKHFLNIIGPMFGGCHWRLKETLNQSNHWLTKPVRKPDSHTRMIGCPQSIDLNFFSAIQLSLVVQHQRNYKLHSAGASLVRVHLAGKTIRSFRCKKNCWEHLCVDLDFFTIFRAVRHAGCDFSGRPLLPSNLHFLSCWKVFTPSNVFRQMQATSCHFACCLQNCIKFEC